MDSGRPREDPREALVWLDQNARKLGNFIGGCFRPPAEGVYFDTLDPSTGEPLAAVAQGAAADIDAAGKNAPGRPAPGPAPSPHPPGRCPYTPAPGGRKQSPRGWGPSNSARWRADFE